MRHAAIFEKVIKYIPVAEETFGGTPICKRRGLKITPPPNPRAPATQPPPKPKHSTLKRIFPWKRRSLGTILTFPYFLFKSYSKADIFTAATTTKIIIIMKSESVVQSPAEHFGNTYPLRKLIVIKKAKEEKLIACFLQIPWLYSYLTNVLSLFSSLSFSLSPVSPIGRPHLSTSWFLAMSISSFITITLSPSFSASTLASFSSTI